MMRRLVNLVAWLVLPLAVLLMAQWPLRELVQAGSRQANDIAQILFAFYAAVSVTAASRAGSHLAAGSTSAPATAWRAVALGACVAPWALYLLVTTAPGVRESLVSLEKFPETFNPGYFLVRISLWLLAALALVQAVLPTSARTSPHG